MAVWSILGGVGGGCEWGGGARVAADGRVPGGAEGGARSFPRGAPSPLYTIYTKMPRPRMCAEQRRE